MQKTIRRLAELLIIAALYFVIARLSLLLAAGNSNATPVWPPSALALAVILARGARMGPAVFLGAFLANVLSLKGLGVSPAAYLIASLVTSTGNMLEGLVGAFLIRRFTGNGNPFENLTDVFVFIFFGSFAGTMISATAGVLTFCFLTGGWLSFQSLWITWWLGDAAGILIVSPVIIMIWNGIREKPGGSHSLEAAAVFLVLAVSTFVIFWKNDHLQYLIIPFLLWIALRFGRLHAATAVCLVSGIAVLNTITGSGSLPPAVLNESLLYLQSYIGVCAIMTLCLSVLTHERSESEQSRSAAQKQLYDIIEFLPDATFAIDTNGKIIAWNRAMEVMTGIPKKEMLAQGNYAYAVPFFGERRPLLINLVMGAPDSARLAQYDKVKQHENTIYAEHYNSLLDRFLAVAACALIDREGNIVGAIESIRDISDRKKAEQDLIALQIREKEEVAKALAVSEGNYRTLVESANSIILRWTPDGTITFFNRYALNFFGFKEEEILGKSIMDTIVPDRESSGRDLGSLMEEIVEKTDEHVVNENENIRKNGERVWIAWGNRAIFDERGALKEILSVGNDITKQKKIEESLRDTLHELAVAKEQAEAADRLKSAFLANMSHELRTPLNSILGFTGIILQGLVGTLNDEQRKQLEMVKGSANHLLALINDILDLSKIESGQMTIVSEPFNLRASLLRVVESVRPLIEKKGLTLEVDLAYGIDSIRGDQRHVEQVMLNLLSNAIKYTDAGTVSVKGTRAGESVLTSIADTGIGIRNEDREKLFKPFQQLDSGTARRYEGTGLGLSICKRLVDLFGGTISVESVAGKGSIFSFTIPIRGAVDEKESIDNRR